MKRENAATQKKSEKAILIPGITPLEQCNNGSRAFNPCNPLIKTYILPIRYAPIIPRNMNLILLGRITYRMVDKGYHCLRQHKGLLNRFLVNAWGACNGSHTVSCTIKIDIL